MSRLTRVIAVTGGLVAAGAIVGAICGAAIIAILTVRDGITISDLFTVENARVLSIAALFGAAVGSVAAPALSWGILCRVPLGRAILATSIGTISGGVLGEILSPLNPYRPGLPPIIVGGFAGFLVGGIVARFTVRRRAVPSGNSTRSRESLE